MALTNSPGVYNPNISNFRLPMLHNIMELGTDLTTGSYELLQVGCSTLLNLFNQYQGHWRSFVCFLFFFQYIKDVPQSRKQQSVLFPAIKECWPSREFYFCLTMSTTTATTFLWPYLIMPIIFTFRTSPHLTS